MVEKESQCSYLDNHLFFYEAANGGNLEYKTLQLKASITQLHSCKWWKRRVQNTTTQSLYHVVSQPLIQVFEAVHCGHIHRQHKYKAWETIYSAVIMFCFT